MYDLRAVLWDTTRHSLAEAPLKDRAHSGASRMCCIVTPKHKKTGSNSEMRVSSSECWTGLHRKVLSRSLGESNELTNRGRARFPAGFPVATVARIPAFGFIFLVAQLRRQLGLQHLFQRLGEQPGENPLFAEKIVDTLRFAQFLAYFLHGRQRRSRFVFWFRLDAVARVVGAICWRYSEFSQNAPLPHPRGLPLPDQTLC